MINIEEPKKEELTLREKWNANSPKRNKRLTNLCVGIVTVAGVILAIPASIVVIPASIVTYATVAVIVGGALGVKSKLTVDNKEIIK